MTDALSITFAGWFQCRLASDPDPTDEPRGVSGCTFATVDEPDFDRIIRFHDPVAPRSLAPAVGVFVKEVDVRGVASLDHPLVGAPVDLMGDAVFVEMNGVVVPQNTAFINPFDIRIGTDRLQIRRSAVWDPLHPQRPYDQFTPDKFHIRQPTLEMGAIEVLSDSGVISPTEYLATRLSKLSELIAAETDPVRIVALQQRIDALHWSDWRGTRLRLLLGARASYDFALNGPAVVIDADTTGSLGTPPTDVHWPIHFWMGAWDNDTLCGYVKGTVRIP